MLVQTPINAWVSTPSFIEMCLLLPNLNEKDYPSLNHFFFVEKFYRIEQLKHLLIDIQMQLFITHMDQRKRQLQLLV